MLYDVFDVARYVIEKCNKESKVITNLKLQKILYFIQAQFLVSNNEPCFSNEIEAWPLGPVIPEVYHRYKAYGATHIPVLFNDYHAHLRFRKEDLSLIDLIIDTCKDFSGRYLSEVTHRQAPWLDARRRFNNNIIYKESIKKYFSEENG